MSVNTQRIYEPVHVRFFPSREVFQTDWGRVIDRENATETHLLLEPELEFRGFRQGFVAVAKIARKKFDIDALERKAKAALVDGLRNRIIVSFFKPTEFYVGEDGREMEEYEADSTLDDIIAPILEEQAKRGKEATDEWKKALNEIDESLRDKYDYQRAKVGNAFTFHQRCHHAAANGLMHLWCEEKLANMEGAFVDINRRKNVNHPGYRSSVETIRGNAANWPVVNRWSEQPPIRHAG